MTDARMMYELLDPRLLYGALGEQTTFLNLGDWKDRPATWHDASNALAIRLGEAAGIGRQQVLDVGFGYGDQDFLWMERFEPSRITGLNISSRQVEAARRSAEGRNLSQLIDFQLGSAVSMPFPNESFDRVIALESAMHFESREQFFHEAFRVLRPGGCIALADIPLMAGASRDPFAPLRSVGDMVVGRYPPQNLYDRDGYAARLGRAGFSAVQVTSIREDVFPGLQAHVLRQAGERARQFNPWLAGAAPFAPAYEGIARFWGNAFWARYDYVIARAEKP